jgi:hypothetical protein
MIGEIGVGGARFGVPLSLLQEYYTATGSHEYYKNTLRKFFFNTG